MTYGVTQTMLGILYSALGLLAIYAGDVGFKAYQEASAKVEQIQADNQRTTDQVNAFAAGLR